MPKTKKKKESQTPSIPAYKQNIAEQQAAIAYLKKQITKIKPQSEDAFLEAIMRARTKHSNKNFAIARQVFRDWKDKPETPDYSLTTEEKRLLKINRIAHLLIQRRSPLLTLISLWILLSHLIILEIIEVVELSAENLPEAA